MVIKTRPFILMIYLFVIAFHPPAVLEYISGMKMITQLLAAARYIISFMSIIYIVSKRRYWACTKSPGIFIFCIAVIFQIIALWMNNTFYLTAGLSCFTFIGFIFCNIIFFENYRTRLFGVYRNILLVFIFFHFVTLAAFPNGIIPGYTGDGRVYFMGSKNVITTYALLALLTSYISFNSDFNNRVFRKKIFRLVSFLTLVIFINGSSTAVLTFLIIDAFILMMCMLYRYRSLEKLLQRLYSAFLVFAAVNFFVFVVVLDGGNNTYMGIITSVLGRDSTFSGRRAIWAAAVTYITEHPLWGLGLGVQYDVWENGKYVYSAHNMYLDYGVKYGCISLVLIVLSIALLFRAASKNRISEQVQVSMIVGIALIFGTMFEAMEGFYSTWAVLLFMYLISYKYKLERRVKEYGGL